MEDLCLFYMKNPHPYRAKCSKGCDQYVVMENVCQLEYIQYICIHICIDTTCKNIYIYIYDIFLHKKKEEESSLKCEYKGQR